MKPDQRDLLVFHFVATSKSFTKAADVLSVSKGHVSKAIARLENQLDLKLFHRSTRALSLTNSGEKLLVTTMAMQQTLDNGLETLQEIKGNPSGVVKISAPPAFGEMILAPIIARYMEKYPEVIVDLVLESRLVDLIAEGYDLMFRSALLSDSNLVARKLLDIEYCLVASPKLFKKYNEPQQPEDLLNLPCVAYKAVGKVSWEFKKSKKIKYVEFTPQLTCNLSSFLMEAATHAAGVTVLPRFLVEEKIARKQLKRLLPDWQLNIKKLYMIYPSRQSMSFKVKSLITFVLDNLSGAV